MTENNEYHTEEYFSYDIFCTTRRSFVRVEGGGARSQSVSTAQQSTAKPIWREANARYRKRQQTPREKNATRKRTES